MRQLGGIDLPSAAEWVDQDEWSPVSQTAVTTLGGEVVVFHQSITSGRPITIEFGDDGTWAVWINKTTRDEIKAIASQSGATFTLVWDTESYIVMFRHQDPPAVSFFPIWPNYDLFVGTIKLIQVQ